MQGYPMNDEFLIAIGRLEGKMDSLLQMHKSQQETLQNHDERLRSLESHKAAMIGAAAIVGGIVSVFIKFIPTTK